MKSTWEPQYLVVKLLSITTILFVEWLDFKPSNQNTVHHNTLEVFDKIVNFE